MGWLRSWRCGMRGGGEIESQVFGSEGGEGGCFMRSRWCLMHMMKKA